MDFLEGMYRLKIILRWTLILPLDLQLPELRDVLSSLSSLSSMYATVNRYFQSLVGLISGTSPSLGSIALLIIVLFLSLKILGMLYRAVIFWVTLAVRVFFLGSLALIAIWMYTRGPDGALEDMQYWGGYWKGEYHKWERQARVAQNAAGYRGHGGRSFWGT